MSTIEAMRLSTFIYGFVFSLLLGCASGPSYKSSFHGTSMRWFGGTPEEAFKEAKNSKRPIFLYWGAVWCPPCNEIKSQVFSHADFPPLMDPVIPVYLDGDTKAAQVWGEKLEVHGYPTMLVLSPKGEEVMRISSFVNFEEFKEAFQSAMIAKQPFRTILAKAAKQRASSAEWRLLAYFEWDKAKGINLTSDEVLEWRRKLSDRVPRQLKKERALLAASVLKAASSAKSSAVVKKIQTEASKYLERVFANPIAIKASRSFVNYNTKSVLKFAFPKGGAKLRKWEGRWTTAARFLRADSSLSIDTRLWTFYPEIAIHELSNKDLPKSLIVSVERAVSAADRAAGTEYQRKAVISGAAYLLRKVGRFAKAEALLKKELVHTTTPWYYQASLARLEEARGNKKAALQWSNKARRSAEGRATRLQWIANDIEMTARLDGDKNNKRLKKLVRELYDVLFSLEGGFLGRNFKYIKSVQKVVVKKAKADPAVAEAAFYFLPDCERLSGKSKNRCVQHLKTFEKFVTTS